MRFADGCALRSWRSDAGLIGARLQQERFPCRWQTVVTAVTVAAAVDLERAEQLPDPLGAFDAALALVQLQGLAQRRPGTLAITVGGVSLAEVVQRGRGLVDVADRPEQLQGLLVELDGLLVVLGVVRDVAEADQGVRLAGRIAALPVKRQGGQA